MGHRRGAEGERDTKSAAWRDAAWLAERIRGLISYPEPQVTRHESFCLLGLRTEVTVRSWPEEWGKSRQYLLISLSVAERRRSKEKDDDLRREKVLVVRQHTAGSRLQAPQTWRRAARPMLRIAQRLRVSGRPPLPFLARYRELYVEETTRTHELVLQLFIILFQWGLAELTEPDMKQLVDYLCSLWRKPDQFRAAAEAAVPIILSNWVIPQDSGDFSRYAKQTVWALFAKGERVPSDRRRKAFGRHRLSREEWAEVKSVRAERGKKITSKAAGTDFTVVGLAQIAATDPRRVYEAIRAGKLRSTKVGPRLRITKADGQEFYLRAIRRREIRDLARQLVKVGRSREAVRKRIYRLRKSGMPDTEIANRLRVELGGPFTASKHVR